MRKIGELAERLGTITLCVFPYAWILISWAFGGSTERQVDLYVGLVALAVLALHMVGWPCCWVALFRMARRGDMRAVATWGLAAKLAYIPIYILGAVANAFAVVFVFIPIPFMIFMSASIIMVTMFVGAFLIAMTSIYSLVAISMLWRRGAIGKIVAWALRIMSFIFVADIIAVVLIRMRVLEIDAEPGVYLES